MQDLYIYKLNRLKNYQKKIKYNTRLLINQKFNSVYKLIAELQNKTIEFPAWILLGADLSCCLFNFFFFYENRVHACQTPKRYC